MRMTDSSFYNKRSTIPLSDKRVRTTSVEPPADPDDPQRTIHVKRILYLK